MKPLPLPLRVAAGLAVTTAERVRELPKQLTGLPVTVVSQALQLSMRVQQHVTELAIKGDDALSLLRPVEDTPSWATFDEDAEPDLAPARPNLVPVDDLPQPHANGHRTPAPGLATNVGDEDGPADPWLEEARALAEDHAEGENDSAGGPATPDDGAGLSHRVEPEVRPADGDESTNQADAHKKAHENAHESTGVSEGGSGPAGLAGYDELTLPQLRARLRRLSVPQLEELLAYEKDHADRASFTGMLARRIANARKADEVNEDGPASGT
ncbi:lipid droplet-associated protein [Amycolatopsis jiangsuensis]|uniref:Lipid droplet-associated protein n=1 Tax=Amycolatopsis jiangsuensis TaxID=1181879 RepID=A0A840J354_9PSEU|nr:lipid droplet-associated protein [Amycolatopsis jiangsuensis]MBB4688490.1 hypothetical protein [Amycolatopsis jiangsuensis]